MRQVTTSLEATRVRFILAGATVLECAPGEAVAKAGEVYRTHGAVPTFEYWTTEEAPPETERTPAPTTISDAFARAKVLATQEPTFNAGIVSEFGDGKQVSDPHALVRIEAQHAALNAVGVRVDAKQQLYATGTRMAQQGYDLQEARRRAFFEMRPAAEAVGELVQAIEAERREDVTTSTHELARNLSSNGTPRAFGLTLAEQAIRSLFGQLGDTSAAGYVLGLGGRIRSIPETMSPAKRDEVAHADAAKASETLAYELLRAPEKRVVLRTRQAGPRDVYAIVSPSYVAADAPTLAPSILRRLPEGTRATTEYDADSTEWSVRLDVWTPTPVADQAVGEAFSGYVGLGSADNGTRAFRGQGGICLLRCLNASQYEAEGRNARRIHRGRILHDIGAMIREARGSIDALIQAWGAARESVVEIPDPMVGMPMSKVLPGLFRGLLTDRQSDLVAVLPGRTETHVASLAAVFPAERRDPSRLVRSDVANAWTRYAQTFSPSVQRDAESAIGAWAVRKTPVRFDLRG